MLFIKEIEDILDNFDFERVKKTMIALDWVYFDTEGSHVSISELRKMARYLLTGVYTSKDSDYYYNSSGGFKAERHMFPGDTKKYLTLEFVVEEWSNVD